MQCRVQFAARWRPATLVALALFLATGTMQARERESAPQPALRIPVLPLGYRPPGRLYLLARYSSSSLDFIDATHLLLTFRQPRLLVREQGSDGLVALLCQAAVLDFKIVVTIPGLAFAVPNLNETDAAFDQSAGN